jgi:hypothetical protein
LDVTEQERNEINELEKRDVIEKAALSLPEQPYWIVSLFNER